MATQTLLALGISERDRFPRHFAEIGFVFVLTPIGTGEDDFELLALILQLFVDFSELRRKTTAGRAPVRREIDTELFPIEIGITKLATRFVSVLAGKQFRESLRLPGEVFALRIFHCASTAFGGNELSIGAENNQRGNPVHFEFLGEGSFQIPFPE